MKNYLTVLALSFVFASNAVAAPLTFNTALPVSKGEYIVREQLIVNKSDNNRTDSSIVSTLVYGITPDFTMFGTVPYTNTTTNDSQEIGNSKIFGRYTIYHDDFQGGTSRIAPFAGVKLPTNQDNTSTDSWDILGGLVATYGNVDFEVDGQISYQANMEANNFEAGDVVRADASLQYRLLPKKLTSDTDSFVNGVVEANLIHKGKNATYGVENANTGGTTLFLAPSLQYAAERYILEAGLQIPVMQNLNSMALENDYIFRTGFRINF